MIIRLDNPFISIKILHILGWCSYLGVLVFSTSSFFGLKAAVLIGIQTVFIHGLLFYFNTRVLMPSLMESKKYVAYFLSIILLIIMAVSIFYFLDIRSKPIGDSPRMNRINVESGVPVTRKSQTMIMVVQRSVMRNSTSVMAILLLSIVYRMFTLRLEKEKREAALNHEQLLSEMKFLKSQVNPHFLFNALNNIYTLVYLKHDKAPIMLLKLSAMLRYMLYECNDEWVLLSKEIDYISNYIELQQLKTEKNQNIQTNFEKVDKNAKIPPLLLIPFIENSFKHSGIEETNTGWLKMHLNSSSTDIHFIISNSIPSKPISKDKTGGIGLENVRRRLELLFSGNYQLKIDQSPKEYTVVLNIKTS